MIFKPSNLIPEGYPEGYLIIEFKRFGVIQSQTRNAQLRFAHSPRKLCFFYTEATIPMLGVRKEITSKSNLLSFLSSPNTKQGFASFYPPFNLHSSIFFQISLVNYFLPCTNIRSVSAHLYILGAKSCGIIKLRVRKNITFEIFFSKSKSRKSFFAEFRFYIPRFPRFFFFWNISIFFL